MDSFRRDGTQKDNGILEHEDTTRSMRTTDMALLSCPSSRIHLPRYIKKKERKKELHAPATATYYDVSIRCVDDRPGDKRNAEEEASSSSIRYYGHYWVQLAIRSAPVRSTSRATHFAGNPGSSVTHHHTHAPARLPSVRVQRPAAQS